MYLLISLSTSSATMRVQFSGWSSYEKLFNCDFKQPSYGRNPLPLISCTLSIVLTLYSLWCLSLQKSWWLAQECQNYIQISEHQKNKQEEKKILTKFLCSFQMSQRVLSEMWCGICMCYLRKCVITQLLGLSYKKLPANNCYLSTVRFLSLADIAD